MFTLHIKGKSSQTFDSLEAIYAYVMHGRIDRSSIMITLPSGRTIQQG